MSATWKPVGIQINPDAALEGDLYGLTDCYACWKLGLLDWQGVFRMFYRRKKRQDKREAEEAGPCLGPFGGNYTINVGLPETLQFIKDFHFDASHLNFLATLRAFDDNVLFPEHEFFDWLAKIEMNVTVRAMPEGSICFADEPILEVEGPLALGYLLETYGLHLTGYPSMVATKASRIRKAAGKEMLVIDFSPRRAPGGGTTVPGSRALYLGGFDATSSMAAGYRHGIPVTGTVAHAWLMSFENEQEAMEAFARAFPGNCVLLIDTYSVKSGIEHAIKVGLYLKSIGRQLYGVRIDSGDLNYLSRLVRNRLDSEGLTKTNILVSGDLEENSILELRNLGAPIDGVGVGTEAVNFRDDPTLGVVYKLGCCRKGIHEPWRHTLKLSDSTPKILIPGAHQVWRFMGEDGLYSHDMIVDRLELPTGEINMINPYDPTHRRKVKSTDQYIEMLQTAFKDRQIVCDLPSVHEIRASIQTELARFHPSVTALHSAYNYQVGIEERLFNLRSELIKQARDRNGA